MQTPDWIKLFAPQATNTECRLLTSLIVDPSRMALTRVEVTAADFAREDYGIIFDAMEQQWLASGTINPDELERRWLPESDVATTFQSLLLLVQKDRWGDKPDSAIHLHTLARAREAIRIAHRILEECYRDAARVDEVLPAAYAQLCDLWADGQERAEAVDRYLELSTMPYHDYLLTPEWKARRDRQVELDGGACRVCGSRASLNVHHRTYERRGDEAPGDLITLCQPCHQLFHQNGKLATSVR